MATQVIYSLTGGVTSFPVPFEVNTLLSSLTVVIDEFEVTTGWTFNTQTSSVVFDVAPTGTELVITRVTDVSEPINTYQDEALINEDAFNESFEQTIYRQQELGDLFVTTNQQLNNRIDEILAEAAGNMVSQTNVSVVGNLMQWSDTDGRKVISSDVHIDTVKTAITQASDNTTAVATNTSNIVTLTATSANHEARISTLETFKTFVALATTGNITLTTNTTDKYTIAQPTGAITLFVTGTAFLGEGDTINVLVTNPGTQFAVDSNIVFPNEEGGVLTDLPTDKVVDLLFKLYPGGFIKGYKLGEV